MCIRYAVHSRYIVGMQYAVGTQYAVGFSAKRSMHTVDLANMGGGFAPRPTAYCVPTAYCTPTAYPTAWV